MIEYAKIYNFYRHPLIKLLRLLVALFLMWLIWQNILNWNFLPMNLNIPISLLSFLLIIEIFFFFKISRYKPTISLGNNDGKNIYTSFTLQVLSTINDGTEEIIKNLLKREEIKFILQKADISGKEIVFVSLPKEEMFKFAFQLVKDAKGKAVTTMDIFAAYILLSEEKTKLLFNKKLKQEEFIHILSWAHYAFAEQETGKSYRVQLWGEGIGEDWVAGWTLETKKYMRDLTPEILSKKPLRVGRDEEYKELIAALSQNKSVILVGEPGSGRTSVVETLAFESFLGNIKDNLRHKRFFKLFVDALTAGVGNKGELEERLENIISEVTHSGNIIIFIPEFENILGSSTFNVDLSGLLLPYLQNRSIRIIATATSSAYKKFIDPSKSMLDVFETIKFDEPNKDTALQMLLQKAPIIETKSKVTLSYKAIVSSLNLADKYLQNRVLPGAAVTLLEDAANEISLSRKKIVEEQDVIERVEKKTKIALSVPDIEEKDLLLNLEEKLHKRIVDQDNAISAIAKGIRRLRSGLASKQKPVSFLFLGPTGVGKTATAKALSELYFGGESQMVRLDMSEFATEDSVKRLLGSGSNDFIDQVYEHPFSLILLDEFEKADIKVTNLFLQALDDGRLTDDKGRTVSFTSAIIIATSNAGSEFIRKEVKSGGVIDKKSFKDKLLEFLQDREIFRPELLNRFDDVIVFELLGEKEVIQVTKLLLDQFVKLMLEKDIVISYEDKLIEKIIKEGYDEQFGARPLGRFIQDNIEDMVAQKLLKNQIKRGDSLNLSVDNAGDIIVKISQ